MITGKKKYTNNEFLCSFSLKNQLDKEMQRITSASSATRMGVFLKMPKKQQQKNIHNYISASFLPHPAAYAGCQAVSSARRKPRCGAITSKSYVWTILDRSAIYEEIRSHKQTHKHRHRKGTSQEPHFPAHTVTANQSFLNLQPRRSSPKALFSKSLCFDARPLSSYSRLEVSS